jgi:RNA polymerase sigma-70 factor (ECF subfamily)
MVETTLRTTARGRADVPSPGTVREDELLVRRARQGEVGAFEGLYRLHVGRVFALCRRMTGEAGLAEDLTQEAFVRAWRNLASFRGESAFSTWLHRLTVNVVLGHLRGRGARQEGLEVEGWDELAPSAPQRPAEAVDLERAIARLPERARTVFVLHDVEGFRHEEIAALAGMAVGTSKAQLHRARRLLREALSP